MESIAEYLPDREVDDVMDKALRFLLPKCFIKPQDVVFHVRRYFRDPYPHRWIIRDKTGVPVAHAGVHEKCVIADDRVYRVGGVADVCVHPDFRKRGYVKKMLACIHVFLEQHEFDFALLFGSPSVYSSSGYRTVSNLWMAPVTEMETHGPTVCVPPPPPPPSERVRVFGMARVLRDRPWPEGAVYLPGNKF